MGSNNKNNQNKNQSADSQTTAANGDEQKTDAATPAATQPADTQQNADTAQPSANVQTATAEPPQDDANAGSNSADNGSAPTAPVVPALPPTAEKTAAKTVTLTLRHKSHTLHYHRCGLALTKVFADYEVPEECVERIKGDKWIEVKDAK